jgi:hypothetical protein
VSSKTSIPAPPPERRLGAQRLTPAWGTLVSRPLATRACMRSPARSARTGALMTGAVRTSRQSNAYPSALENAAPRALPPCRECSVSLALGAGGGDRGEVRFDRRSGALRRRPYARISAASLEAGSERRVRDSPALAVTAEPERTPELPTADGAVGSEVVRSLGE